MRAWFPALLSLLVLPMGWALTLAWNPVPGATGYKLYYGATSRTYTAVMDVGNATTGRVSGLVGGKPYFFAVTAYTPAAESDFSAELAVTPTLIGPPALSALPEGVTVSLEGTAVLTGRWETVAATQFFYRAKVSP